MKRCFKCLCEKPLDEFYRHSQMGDGRLNKCKDCTKKDVSQHRQENLERVRSYDRMRGSMPHRVAARQEYQKTPQGKAALKRAHEKYKVTHAKRRKAQVAVSNAVRDGRLSKQPCWVCGEKAEAHHPDYDRPLDVIWLCQPHHKQAHALVANDNDYEQSA
jgi:hypothetical protein